jgi:hypothetical protein
MRGQKAATSRDRRFLQSAAPVPIGRHDFNIETDNRFISRVPFGACLMRTLSC